MATHRPADSEETAVFAYDFPLLSLVVALFFFFLFLSLFFAVIWCFVDNFRRNDHGGWAKAGWTVALLLIPLIGMVVYLVTRPNLPTT